MLHNRAEKITTSITTALTQYYLEHGSVDLKITLHREEKAIYLCFTGDVVMTDESFELLRKVLSQPTVAENEYYYMELIDSSAKQDLRILGSLIDVLDMSFDGRTLELNLVKRYPEGT